MNKTLRNTKLKVLYFGLEDKPITVIEGNKKLNKLLDKERILIIIIRTIIHYE